MHVLVWGSIIVWFVVIPITSTGAFYSAFFRYGGVAYEVLNTANFWFYLPISAVVALLPTIVSRLVSLYLNPAYVDFVRLKEKKEGKKLFKRKKMTRRSATQHSTKRSGYAFSHQQGFGDMITTGHIFGMNQETVAAEHMRRRSVLLSASHSRAGTAEPPQSTSHLVAAAAARLSGGVVGIDANITIEVVEKEELGSICEENTSGGISRESVSQDDDHAMLLSHEAQQEDPVTESSEQTDSALMPPPLRIPGLVDSPGSKEDEDDVAESGDQETTATPPPPNDSENALGVV